MKIQQIALSIAGSDSSAGAGIQADLKTFAAHKVYGICVITAITAQNTTQISDVFKVPLDIIESQLSTLLEDFSIDAIKTGMLVSSEIVKLIAARLSKLSIPIVVDPIIKAGTGRDLLESEAIESMISHLFPIAEVITPNIFEAETISGIIIRSEVDIVRAGEKFIKMGANAVLIKGGHLISRGVVDFLILKDGTQKTFQKTRHSDQDRHGSGCVLSAAITANLTKGFDLPEAVERAEKFIERIYPSPIKVGKGTSPMNPFFNLF